MTTQSPSRVHRTTLTEAQVIDYFWAACRAGAERLPLVQQLAVVAVPTAPSWSAKAVREAFVARPYPETGCFICFHRDRKLAWHHIIAVDHGGSNGLWNTVPVCHVCHRRIHPWLEEEPDTGSWASTDQLVTRLASGRVQLSPDRRQVHDDDGVLRRSILSADAAVAETDEDVLYRRGGCR